MKNLKKLALNGILYWCCSLLITSNCTAQIPNWDMETWSTITNDVPQQWTCFGNTTKVTPGYTGLTALKLQGDVNRGPGAVLQGNPNNNNFEGGMPFTARPDSLVAYFKYSIEAGDSAWVLMIFKKNGVNISNDLYLYTGTNLASFKRMAFKINYTNSSVPDTLFIGFTSTNPNNSSGVINANSYVIIDNISFVGTTQNVPNPDFENWTTTNVYMPQGWRSDDKGNGVTAVQRSTDKYSGNYAMKLKTIYASNGDTMDGYTETTNNYSNTTSWGPSFPVNARPNSLKGFYKFTPQNGDTFRINVMLFKAGQQVGYAEYFSGAAYNTYTPFSTTINYFNLPSGNVDSGSISISTFMMGQFSNNPRGQSEAFIDNLSFDNYVYAGIKETSKTNNIVCVYPNPTNSLTYIKLNNIDDDLITINVVDLNGKQLMKLADIAIKKGDYTFEFDAAQLKSGFYFLQISGNTTAIMKKFLVE